MIELASRCGDVTDGRDRTLQEVGHEFGLTRERIRQIEVKALRKLRHLWGTNIRSRPESRELKSASGIRPASALGSQADLLRSSPLVSRAVPPVFPGGDAFGIGAADF